MGVGRIGGALVVLGWAIVVLLAVMGASGQAVGIGVAGEGGMLTAGAFAALGAGTALLCLGGPTPLDGRAVRLGLGILAVGLLSSLASSIWAAALTYDPLESLPVITLFLVGMLATFLGALVTALALLGSSGRARTVGTILLVGLALVPLAVLGSVAAPGLATAMTVLAWIGGCAIVAGGVGIGVLAILAERRAVAVT